MKKKKIIKITIKKIMEKKTKNKIIISDLFIK